MQRKIFGVGLNKTGTTSLKLAFQKLGFDHLDRRPRLFKLWQKQKFDVIFEHIHEFESFEDWPWPLMVPELLEHFDKEAVFVLTRRKSPLAWVESLKNHSLRTHPIRNPRQAIFGHPYPHGYEDEFMAFYEAHLENTRALFSDRPDQLVELCWEEGDGWKELCSFLNVKVPNKPFPHANRADSSDIDPERLAENQRLIELNRPAAN